MQQWAGLLLLMVTAMPILAGGEKKIDPKDWTPVKIPGQQRAPEFADIETWLHSDPLAMSKLRGKVVVVHFMAFG